MLGFAAGPRASCWPAGDARANVFEAESLASLLASGEAWLIRRAPLRDLGNAPADALCDQRAPTYTYQVGASRGALPRPDEESGCEKFALRTPDAPG